MCISCCENQTWEYSVTEQFCVLMNLCAYKLFVPASCSINPSMLTCAKIAGASYNPTGPCLRLIQGPAEHDKGVLRGLPSINLTFLPLWLGALKHKRLCRYDRVRRCQCGLKNRAWFQRRREREREIFIPVSCVQMTVKFLIDEIK